MDLGSTSTSAIFPLRPPAERVNDSQGSCVLEELSGIGIVACSTLLPLAAKEVLKQILTKVLAQEGKSVVFHLRKSEEKAHQTNK